MKSSRLGLVALAVLLATFLGCASQTIVRLGQINTGGHVAITKPGLSVSPADEGFGFKAQFGHLQFGYTTTLDTDASHFVLGIDSSTGFDGEKNTLIISASRIGVANANIGGELAIGLKRITLKGNAKIDSGPLLPALYLDHWTGATPAYEPFKEAAGNMSGGMLECSRYITFGPFGLTSNLDILNECRPCTIGCIDGQCDAGLGPFLLNMGATNGECSHAFGFGCYIGIPGNLKGGNTYDWSISQ